MKLASVPCDLSWFETYFEICELTRCILHYYSFLIVRVRILDVRVSLPIPDLSSKQSFWLTPTPVYYPKGGVHDIAAATTTTTATIGEKQGAHIQSEKKKKNRLIWCQKKFHPFLSFFPVMHWTYLLIWLDLTDWRTTNWLSSLDQGERGREKELRRRGRSRSRRRKSENWKGGKIMVPEGFSSVLAPPCMCWIFLPT